MHSFAAFPSPENPAVQFFAFAGTIGDAIAVIAVLIAGFAIVNELRRAAAEKASGLAAWAAIPHNRINSAGVRGVVISNTTGEVARDVGVTVALEDGTTLTDTYAVVPPGQHFLPLQIRSARNEPWEPRNQQEFVPYWMLPCGDVDNVPHVKLRNGRELAQFEVQPWAHATSSGVFVVKRTTYQLGMQHWTRDPEGRVKRVKGSRDATSSAPQDDMILRQRSFPEVALTEEQEVASLEENQSSYQEAFDLITSVASRLTEVGELAPGTTVKSASRIRDLGIERVHRSKTVQRGGRVRGGLILDFHVDSTEEKPTSVYSIGANEFGIVPAWFMRVDGRGATATRKSLLKSDVFSGKRKAGDWTGADLADAVVAAIGADSKRSSPDD